MIVRMGGNAYVEARDVRKGDVLIQTYGDCEVFSVYENRRGTVSICAVAPWGEHEYRHRPTTKLVIRRMP